MKKIGWFSLLMFGIVPFFIVEYLLRKRETTGNRSMVAKIDGFQKSRRENRKS